MRALLPLVVLIVAALAGVIVWLVYATTHPSARPYIVTPNSFQQLSERGLSATDEEWQLSDGAMARGWLLRGKQSAPAVIFLHPYGGNRSYFLNLGIKLNEATNFTVLWIDARGHGAENPAGGSSFGTREAGDIAAAAAFLRTLTTRNGEPLTGGNTGIYGVEMGAYTALVAAADNPGVRVLVLDSVVANPGELLNTALAARTGLTDPLSRFSPKQVRVCTSPETFRAQPRVKRRLKSVRPNA
jgi:pimeloyl-ACP methyl ester carboxylesterase